MIFVNVSPLLWDIIIVSIIIFGVVTGFFIGGRALTFISAGNLLSIGLMLAFRPMLINTFDNMIAPWFSDFSGNFASFKQLLIDNVGFTIYALIWITGVNILFWTIYIILYFSLFKKNKIEYKAINAITGVFINFIRMSIVGGMIIMMMSSNIFGNKLLSYGVIKNEIPTTAVTYKVFSNFDNNLPFLNINITDINTIITLYQNNQALQKGFEELETDTTYEACNSTFEKIKTLDVLREEEINHISQLLEEAKQRGDVTLSKKEIIETLIDHCSNNLLDVNYMVSLFNAYANIINLYSQVVAVFADNFEYMMEITQIDTSLPQNNGRYNLLKPKITAFIDSIQLATVKAEIEQNLKNIYDPF